MVLKFGKNQSKLLVELTIYTVFFFQTSLIGKMVGDPSIINPMYTGKQWISVYFLLKRSFGVLNSSGTIGFSI